MYANLATAAPHIAPSQIPNFFKDATFGVPAGQVASSESPEPGVTIERDKSFGVPHIYGDTRAELMFGIGYASAEDRLFFIDALRHAGEGDLAQFAGGANAAMDAQVWASEPYTQQDLVNQVQFGLAHSKEGPQILSDATNYVAGLNAYVAKAENPLFTGTMMPAEYFALGMSGPQPFTVEDLVKIATLVGGIFGNGGGTQLSNAVLYQNLEKKFGTERRLMAGSPEPKPKAGWVPAKSKDKSGFATFLSFDDPSDPEAPTTVHGKSFPYQRLPAPGKRTRARVALPDRGSVKYVNDVVGGSLPAGQSSGSGTPGSAGPGNTGSSGGSSSGTPGIPGLPGLPGGLGAAISGGLIGGKRSMSNALLISAKHSASGHPLAVMGPQVSYYAPEILMEEDIHGPGIDADGAAFPGVNLYVELGHGRDYAWSATSAGQNIVDTFAVPLCNPSGGAVSTSSDFYMLNGHCVQMETLTRTESWKPNLADSTPAGSMTLQTKRTAYGIVLARATVGHKPVVYTNLRSTYMHELDSALGFEQFNEPALMRNPQDFMKAASNIQYTFNWFYTDDKHIAYFNSGLNPVRAPGTDPLFPTWAKYPWRGYHPAAAMTPASLTETQTPPKAHPQAIDQAFFTSWNNKQAPGYNDAATGQQYASVFRSQLLDNNIQPLLGCRPRQAAARRPDQRDGHRRNAGSARRGGAALRAEADRDPQEPHPRHGRGRAESLGRQRRSPHQPRAGGWVRIGYGQLRPERRCADHGRLVAAVGQGGVPARARPDAARPDRERLPDQRRARARRVRGPPRLRVRRGLLRDRPEGPTRRAGQEGSRAAEPRLLRQGQPRGLPRGAAGVVAAGRRRVAAAGVSGRRRVQRRRSDVL